jgi:hypothetical protein
VRTRRYLAAETCANDPGASGRAVRCDTELRKAVERIIVQVREMAERKKLRVDETAGEEKELDHGANWRSPLDGQIRATIGSGERKFGDAIVSVGAAFRGDGKTMQGR